MLQRRLILGLDSSDAFAGLYPLTSPHENTEVEVLIEPAVIEAESGSCGFDHLLLQVRVYRKHDHSDGFDKRYRGKASGNRDALDELLKPLGRDLKRGFGAKSVY